MRLSGLQDHQIITLRDFFLLRYLESTVYFTFPANTQGLMEKIFNEAQVLKEDPQLIERVMGAMKKKLDLYLRSDEAHVEGSAGILGV